MNKPQAMIGELFEPVGTSGILRAFWSTAMGSYYNGYFYHRVNKFLNSSKKSKRKMIVKK